MQEQAQGKAGEVPCSSEAQIFVNALLFIYFKTLSPGVKDPHSEWQ